MSSSKKKSSKAKTEEQIATSPSVELKTKSPIENEFKFTELSESFGTFLKAVCDTNLTSTLLAYTQTLAERTSIPQQKMIDVWNEIVPDYVIKLGQQAKSTTPTTISGKICSYYFPKAKKACDCEVSVRSKTGRWCSKHLNQEEKKADDSKTNVPASPRAECEYTPTKGKNPNVKCTNPVCAKSKRFCSRHVKSGEKAEKTESKRKESKDENVMTIQPKYNKKFNVYVDVETNFVLDRESKDIYAKLKDGKIIALTTEDKELLDKHKYHYNADLFSLKSQEGEKSDNESDSEDEQNGEESDKSDDE